MKVQLSFKSCTFSLAQSEHSPVLKIFVSGSSDPPQTLDSNLRTLSLSFTLPEPLAPDTILGIDCYTQQKNYAQRDCTVRTACDSLYLSELFQGKPIKCSLTRSGGTPETKATVVVQSQRCSPQWKPTKTTDLVRNQQISCKNTMVEYINRNIRKMRSMTPIVSILSRIHAPVYKTRCTTLPGLAYWMTDCSMTEEYVEHLIRMVLKRHNCSEETFLQEKNVQILCDVCLAFPTSCSYITDYISRGKELIECESFDDIFVREAGDCEDLSRGICMIFNNIRFTTWKRPLTQHLQLLSTAYIAFGALGSVTRPSFGKKGGSLSAHMFTQFIPVTLFNTLTEKKYRQPEEPWMKGLMPMVGEGTGHVGCDVLKGTPGTCDEHLVSKCWNGNVVSVDRTSYPNMHNSFYRHVSHLFTNFFFKQGFNIGHFTFLTKPKTYGVTFSSLYKKLSPGSRSLYTHEGFTTQNMAIIQSALALEYPTPPLTVTQSMKEHIGARLSPTPPGQYVDCYVFPCFKKQADGFIQSFQTKMKQHGGKQCVGTEWIQEQFSPTHSVFRVRMWFQPLNFYSSTPLRITQEVKNH